MPTILVIMPGLSAFTSRVGWGFHGAQVAFVAAAVLIGCGGGGGGGSSSATGLSGGSSTGSTAGSTDGSSTTGTTTSGSTGSTAFDVFYSSDKTGAFKLVKIKSDGASRVALVPGESPALRHDGAKIAYVVYDQDFYAHVYVSNADGTGAQQLTTGSQDDTDPSFSPDGSKVLFTSSRNGTPQLFTMSATDGTNVQQVTDDPNGAREGRYSPDGSKIVYTSTGMTDDVYVVNADGTGATPLAGDSTLDENNPSFSPDGTLVVFSKRIDNGGTPTGQIFTVPAAGGAQTRLTSSLADDREPCFSLDGSTILFTRAVSTHREVFRMAANGSGQAAVTNDAATAARPSTGA